MFGSKLIGSLETAPETLTGNSVVEPPLLCKESLDPSPANMNHAEMHEMRSIKRMQRRIEITPAAGLHQLCQNERPESGTFAVNPLNHCELSIKLRNAGQQRPQLGNQGLHHQGTGFQYSLVLRQRASILDLLQLFMPIQ